MKNKHSDTKVKKGEIDDVAKTQARQGNTKKRMKRFQEWPK